MIRSSLLKYSDVISDVTQALIFLSVLFIGWAYIPVLEIKLQTELPIATGFGLIGTWRYCWWLNHVIRSRLYAHFIFPSRRARANQLWASGWRPTRLLIMMTTFQELVTTTERVLNSILTESRELGVPVSLFIGTGSLEDEAHVEAFFTTCHSNLPFDVTFVRQKKPGKRYAIGETLRAMLRHGLETEDLVVFMDGDTFFEPGCLRLCLPFFPLHPKMQALTTHEESIVLNGPTWMRKWLDMRFAQRDFTMQSYALSQKILTLTGRMSIFRGKHLLEPAFLEIIEQDHLSHWLWGEYRFLSGDDKSTWYYLLKQGADMTYIPDAKTITIEYIQGSAVDRMKENLRRWSGNTLRNGARAIALGPKRTGYFIWWCLIDQRCTIWTMLIGHMTIITLTLCHNLIYLYVSLLWIAFSRFCISTVLFTHARRIDMSFPFLLYINQFMTTITKIYILFRLPQQRWKNRGDQQAGFGGQSRRNTKAWIASYLTFFYCMGCFLVVLLGLHLIQLPNQSDVFLLFN